MKKIVTAVALMLAFTANTGAAVAQDGLIDLKGRWMGMSESIVAGNAPHYGPSQAEPVLSSVQFDFTITGQEGRRFWGTVASKAGEESIMGVIGLDGKMIVARDKDGLIQGTIVDADTIDLIYSHTGTSTVVAANRLKRQK
jgi:hypothetical protein